MMVFVAQFRSRSSLARHAISAVADASLWFPAPCCIDCVRMPRSYRRAQHRAAFIEQLPEVPPFLLGCIRVLPMLRYGQANPLDSFRRLRPGTQSAMKPATSVWHRGTLTVCTPPGLRSTPWCLAEVSRRVPVLQPSAPPLMGCTTHFRTPPRPVTPGLQLSCSRQLPLARRPIPERAEPPPSAYPRFVSCEE